MIKLPPILTVDLAGWGAGDHVLAKARTKTVWHIVRRGADNPQVTLCALEIPEGAQVEADIDAHVVQLFGRPVCSRCRRRLQ